MGQCRTCEGKCYVLTLKCLYDMANMLNPELPTIKLKAYMEKAQRRYVKTLLGDCYDDLCEAIRLSEIDPEQEGYVELAQKWIDLTDAVSEVIAYGTQYLFFKDMGYGQMKNNGFKFMEGLDIVGYQSLLSSMKTDVDEAYQYLKDWLHEDAQQETYDCLPECDCCNTEEGEYNTTWGTTKTVSEPYRRGTPNRFRE